MSYSETITKEDLKNVLNELLPLPTHTAKIGEIIAYAGNNEPLGWLKCDGRAISRTTYSALFTVIGTTYGSGDGSTTFNLPDLKGRTIVGVDPSDTSSSGINFSTLGSTKGSKYLQSHSHTLHGMYLYAGSAGSAYSFNTYTGSETYTGSAGSGSSQNIQPSIVLNYLIYVGGDFAPIDVTPSMDDWIIEQGTNENGTYRKWNSGILEQWGYTTIGSNSAASWTYPIPFYSTKIYLTASCHYLSSGTYVAPTISVQPLYTNYANIYARCSTSTVTSAHTVSCHAIGTWK